MSLSTIEGPLRGLFSVRIAKNTDFDAFRKNIWEFSFYPQEQNVHNKSKASTTTTTATTTGKLRSTQPKPFSFETKDKVRYSKKEEKIKEQILAEKKVITWFVFRSSFFPTFSSMIHWIYFIPFRYLLLGSILSEASSSFSFI